MAESSSQVPSSPPIIPKEEPVTQDRPKSPNPFLPADKLNFNFDEMLFTTNNEVALVSTPTGGVRGEIGVTTFRNAIGAHYTNEYVNSPFAIVKPWFAEIGYNGEIRVKGTLKKRYVPNVPKAPKPSSHTSESNSEASNFQAGQIGKENMSSMVIDNNPSQPSASTPVDTKLHKEVQQAAGCPTSLGVTTKEGVHPQISSGMSAFTNIKPVFLASYIFHSEFASGNDALADFTAEADPRISAPKDFVPHQQGLDEGSKNYTPDHTFAGTNPSVLVDKTKSAKDGSQTTHTISAQILLLKSQNQKLKQDKEKAAAEIATLKLSLSSIPIELKELPTKITTLFGEVNKLKKHIKEFEVELPKELPKEFLDLPGQISSVQSHIQTLKALLGLLNKVTDTLHMFANVLNAHNKGVPSTGKSTASLAEGEKNTNPVTKDAELANLVDLIGINVVEEYHKKKLLYNKYCDKMLKRKKSPKITNCEVLTKKGPITLKIYREDGSEEVISNIKVSDLYLAEWREVTQACPEKSEKGWKTIYALVKTRLDQLTQTEQELKIDINKPLKEQDPLNELNELSNKKSEEY
ncbi:hypothetical protein Tco_0316438 [Tanacetum coccineum]